MRNLKKHITLFAKGIFIGIGGAAPGLSGSIIMIGLGLYSRTIDAIATLNKDFKKKIIFLAPIILGMLISTILFSRTIDSSLDRFEIQTRLAFFGMVIGTIPLFFAEVKRKGRLKTSHYLIMGLSFLLGIGLLFLGSISSVAETITMPIAFVLGFFGIILTIIPGLNWVTFFSAFGLYDHWLTLVSFRLENFSFAIYVPVLIGGAVALITVPRAINFLFRKAYIATFSALFGFFIAVIPSIIIDSRGSLDNLSFGVSVYIGIALFIVGIFIAYWFGKLSNLNAKDKITDKQN